MLLLTLIVVCGADTTSGDIKADTLMRLEQRLASHEADNAALRQQQERGERRIAALEAMLHTTQQLDTAVNGEGTLHKPQQLDTAVNGGPRGGVGGRRLTARSSSYIAADALQLHKFDAGHSCSNTVSGYKALLPLKASGEVEWDPSPTVLTSNLTFGLVGNDWSVASVQSFTAPFIIQHDAACAAEPTLRLGLDTTVQTLTVEDKLIVNGAELGGGLTWTAVPYATGYQSPWSDSSFALYYAVKDGLVFLSGGVARVDGSNFAAGTDIVLATLPAPARPSRGMFVTATNYQSNPDGVVTITLASSGEIRHGVSTVSTGATYIWFDGIAVRM